MIRLDETEPILDYVQNHRIEEKNSGSKGC